MSRITVICDSFRIQGAEVSPTPIVDQALDDCLGSWCWSKNLWPGDATPRTFSEQPEVGTSHARSMAELSMEIQAIMNRVNYTFANRSQALAEEFLGLQAAIQATLQV